MFMYRVLITGDTHGHIKSVLELMENVAFDAVIHLGDYVRDASEIAKIYKDKKVYFVRGNNDFSGENEKVIEIAGHKIFICHGHTLGVNSNLLKLSLAAREKGALVALHGHTHVPEDLMVNSVRIFSPGSPTYPRMSSPAVGILEADDNYFEMAHYYMK